MKLPTSVLANFECGRAGDRGVWRRFVCAVVTSVLTACGGGGGGGGEVAEAGGSLPMAVALAAGAAQQQSARSRPGQALIAQPVSLVNTTTAGNQNLRAIGALEDGGFAVSWISDTTLYVQRYDSDGSTSGTETAISLVLDPRDTPSQILASSSVAVLSDGSVVVAYDTMRSSTEPNSPIITTYGAYIQRFDANGVQVLPETPLATHVGGDPRRPTTYELLQVLPMPDGGYVVGWATFSTSATVGYRAGFSTQRFDSQNQPVGEVGGVAGERPAGTSNELYRIAADGMGGYTLYWSGLKADFSPTGLYVVHYNDKGTATQILTAWPGSAFSSPASALLVPLEQGRYVLYTNGDEGVYRTFLDSAGTPVGERSAVSSMPVSAQLLADGSYVVFWTSAGGMTGQRFDSNGQPIGDMLSIQTNGTQPIAAALVEGGFVAAWSGPGASADLDVFAQRFIEVTDNQRRACLASAKGLRGQERKAAVMACLR